MTSHINIVTDEDLRGRNVLPSICFTATCPAQELPSHTFDYWYHAGEYAPEKHECQPILHQVPGRLLNFTKY